MHGALGLFNQFFRADGDETACLELAFVAGGFHERCENCLVGERENVWRCALVYGAMAERFVEELDQRLVLDRYGFRLQTDELEVLSNDE